MSTLENDPERARLKRENELLARLHGCVWIENNNHAWAKCTICSHEFDDLDSTYRPLMERIVEHYNVYHAHKGRTE